MNGLGVAAFSLDWTSIASFLGSPLVSPFFATVNVAVGYVAFMYLIMPTVYWGFNLFNAKNFPIFSSDLFDSHGQVYNVSAIVNNQFQIDMPAYEKQGRVSLSMFFALSYGIGFAAIVSTLTHVALFNGREIYEQFRASKKDGKTSGLNVITEYAIGLILPGKPILNVCFKTYGYISMAQAISFLNDFKLGHYMKIPPRSMFIVQLIGTVIAGTVNIGVAWWLLSTVENICQHELLPPNSPWTCPNDRVFFDASVLWGLVGPKRMFGSLGNYPALNWFFLLGAFGPLLVWLLHRAFPSHKWIQLINLPVLLGATANMPPATAVNYNCWIITGTIFGYFVFRYRKAWWLRYNYVLSAALDAGVTFMAVLLYFTLTMNETSVSWRGANGEHCELVTCPTAKGIVVDGCPVY
ncbi:hypothetical protein ACLB2K_045923 [Fragaria x ananassa]